MKLNWAFVLKLVQYTLSRKHFGARVTLVNNNIMALKHSGTYDIGLLMLHLDFCTLTNS